MNPEAKEMEDVREFIAEVLSWAHRELKIDPAFFVKMMEDDDWTFLIKWHAIIEACANHMLTTHFKEPRLFDTFARLEMSNPRTGKMAFLSKAGLLSEETRAFIQVMSEMRNHAVHDIKNFGFTFEGYMGLLDGKLDTWLKHVTACLPKNTVGLPANSPKTAIELARLMPRLAIHINCLLLLTHCFGFHTVFQLKQGIASQLQEIGRKEVADWTASRPQSTASIPSPTPKESGDSRLSPDHQG